MGKGRLGQVVCSEPAREKARRAGITHVLPKQPTSHQLGLGYDSRKSARAVANHPTLDLSGSADRHAFSSPTYAPSHVHGMCMEFAICANYAAGANRSIFNLHIPKVLIYLNSVPGYHHSKRFSGFRRRIPNPRSNPRFGDPIDDFSLNPLCEQVHPVAQKLLQELALCLAHRLHVRLCVKLHSRPEVLVTQHPLHRLRIHP